MSKSKNEIEAMLNRIKEIRNEIENKLESSTDRDSIVENFNKKFEEIATHLSEILMGQVKGKTLKDLIENTNLTEQQLIEISIGVFKQLQQIVEQGVVHSDINPTNIMVDPSKSSVEVGVLDLGAEIASNTLQKLKPMENQEMRSSLSGSKIYRSSEPNLGQMLRFRFKVLDPALKAFKKGNAEALSTFLDKLKEDDLNRLQSLDLNQYRGHLRKEIEGLQKAVNEWVLVEKKQQPTHGAINMKK